MRAHAIMLGAPTAAGALLHDSARAGDRFARCMDRTARTGTPFVRARRARPGNSQCGFVYIRLILPPRIRSLRRLCHRCGTSVFVTKSL